MSNIKKHKNRIVVTIIITILFILMAFTAKNRHNLSNFENKVGSIITPIQEVVKNIGESFFNTFRSITSLSKIKKENDELQKQLAKIKKENRELKDIIARSVFLRNEARLKQNSEYNLIDGQVVSKDPGNWFNRFVVNRGSNDGVEKGTPVIIGVETNDGVVESGLIGRVVEVGSNWSKVLSVIDEASNVSFKVIRTQDNGIISGSIEKKLNGFLFDTNADVVVGDKLITSGIGEVYTRGLYIGRISKVIKKNEELIKRIEVESSVDFKNLNEVFLIIEE